MIAKAEIAFEKAAREIQDSLANEDVGFFILTFQASGHASLSDTKIEYSLNCGNSNVVTGSSVKAVLEELLRQRSWAKRNAPICLSAPTKEEANGTDF